MKLGEKNKCVRIRRLADLIKILPRVKKKKGRNAAHCSFVLLQSRKIHRDAVKWPIEFMQHKCAMQGTMIVVLPLSKKMYSKLFLWTCLTLLLYFLCLQNFCAESVSLFLLHAAKVFNSYHNSFIFRTSCGANNLSSTKLF